MSLALYRPVMTAMRQEVERGTSPVTIVESLQPVLANLIATLILNTDISEVGAERLVERFATGLGNEVSARMRRVYGGDRSSDLVVPVKTVEGGTA